MADLNIPAAAIVLATGAGSAAMGDIYGVPHAAILGSFVGALVVRVLVDKNYPQSFRDFLFAIVVMITTTLMASIFAYGFGKKLLVWEWVENLAQAYLISGLAFGLGSQAIAEQASQFIKRVTDGAADAIVNRFFFPKKKESE